MRAMLEWLEVSRNTLCETQRAERSEKDRTPHPDPLPSGERGTEADVHTAPTYPRPFSAHYAPLTAPALDGIASERFAGTGSDGGCRTLLAEVPAGRMPFPKGWPRAASGVTAAFGRPEAEAPFMGSRGACAETSGASAPWIWTAGISPLLREAGRSNPPVARHCGFGEIPAVRRSEVENSGRAGEARPRIIADYPP
jgi:hypothetical protein